SIRIPSNLLRILNSSFTSFLDIEETLKVPLACCATNPSPSNFCKASLIGVRLTPSSFSRLTLLIVESGLSSSLMILSFTCSYAISLVEILVNPLIVLVKFSFTSVIRIIVYNYYNVHNSDYNEYYNISDN